MSFVAPANLNDPRAGRIVSGLLADPDKQWDMELRSNIWSMVVVVVVVTN